MTDLEFPVRYYLDFPGTYDYAFETLRLALEQSAFLLVNADWDLIGYSSTSKEIINALQNPAR